MMKTAVAVLVAVMLITPAAFAQGFGLGWEDGVSGKVPAGMFTIQGVLGFDSTSYENDAIDSVFDFDISGYVAFPLMNISDSKLNVFGGLGLMFSNDDDREMDIAIRGGLQHDVMVTDYVGVSGKAGLQAYMYNGYDGIKDGQTSIGTWGTVGIYWFFM